MNFPRPLCNPVIVLEHAWRAITDVTSNNLVVVECGVYHGFTSVFLAHGLGKHKRGEKIRQIAIDTFSGFPYSGGPDEKYTEGELHGGGRHTVSQLQNLGIEVLVGRVEETPESLACKKFSFVFLDLDLEAPTRFAWNFFRNKMRPGGRIGFHDYGSPSLPGIKRVGDKALKDKRFFECFRSNGRRDNRFLFLQRG